MSLIWSAISCRLFATLAQAPRSILSAFLLVELARTVLQSAESLPWLPTGIVRPEAGTYGIAFPYFLGICNL